MIITRLSGGLGNQMFQYAIARALSERYQTAFILNRSWFNAPQGNATPRELQLSLLNIKDIRFTDEAFPKKLGKIGRFLQRFEPTQPLVIYQRNAFDFDPSLFKLKNTSTRDLYLSGYWQAFPYIDLIREQLRKELSNLPTNATEADILAVVTKYGSPDKVLATLQASTDKAAQRDLLVSQQAERLAQQERLVKEKLEAQAEQARKDNEARLERARENNASKTELARISAEGRAAQNAITNSIREQTLQLRQEAANEKKVAAERQQQGVVASFDSALDTLNTIATHPGKKAAVGFGGAQLSMIPGTDAAGFAAQLETFKAQTFLPQVQALKGMGALSDAEGKKLEAAVGALSQSMKQSEFDSQIVKIKSYLQAAKDRLSKNLPTSSTPMPTSTPAPKGNVVKFSDLP
jgi:hypothetical protein